MPHVLATVEAHGAVLSVVLGFGLLKRQATMVNTSPPSILAGSWEGHLNREHSQCREDPVKDLRGHHLERGRGYIERNARGRRRRREETDCVKEAKLPPSDALRGDPGLDQML